MHTEEFEELEKHLRKCEEDVAKTSLILDHSHTIDNAVAYSEALKARKNARNAIKAAEEAEVNDL